VFLGCTESAPPLAADRAAPVKEIAPEQTQAAKVDVRPVDRKQFDAVIADHKGKVVLVDYWATWCLPCVEQLPHTIGLAEKFRDQGLAVVTVSCDEPDEAARVSELLSTKSTGIATNLISQFGGSSRTMEEFEIASGTVPYYAIYDRTGRLRKTFGVNPIAKTQYTPTDIDVAVEALLAE